MSGLSGGGPLPLELRVLGALLVAHGVRGVTVTDLADVLNMPAIHVARACDQLEAMELVAGVRRLCPPEEKRFTAAEYIELTDVIGVPDGLGVAQQCPVMGMVLAFPEPANAVPESVA